jgi:hypothetical protein
MLKMVRWKMSHDARDSLEITTICEYVGRLSFGLYMDRPASLQRDIR